MVITLVVGLISVLVIGALLIIFQAEFQNSRKIQDLQADADVVSYNIKGISEEADSETILDSGRRLEVSRGSIWRRAFYPEGEELVMEDLQTGSKETLTPMLKSILFTSVEPGLVSVDLVLHTWLKNSERELSNTFDVYLRNRERE